MRLRKRWILTLVAVVAFLMGLLTALSQQIRNAPLPGSDTQQTLVTVQADGADEIPFGVPGRDLALTVKRGADWDIAFIAADGTLTMLTQDDTGAHDYFPSWAMDGKQINFLSNRLDAAVLGPSQVNPDGSGLDNLTIVGAMFSLTQSGRFDWDPVWSPDGTRLLWSSLRDLNLEQYLIATDQEFIVSNAQRLTNSGARDWFGAWSPDGTSVLRSSDGSGSEDIYRVTLATGEETLLAGAAWDETRPAYALDGAALIYVSDEGDALTKGQLNLWHITDGTSAALGTTRFAGAPVWTPDGSQVAYMSNESGRWQVYVMSSDGTNRRRITPEDGDYVFPVWRP